MLTTKEKEYAQPLSHLEGQGHMPQTGLPLCTLCCVHIGYNKVTIGHGLSYQACITILSMLQP